MLNKIWISFFLIALLSAFLRVFQGDYLVFDEIMRSVFSMSKTGFEISLGLTGVMAFWLGIMRIGESAGLIRVLTRLVSPFFSRLFPAVPSDHPAMGSMMMNFAANMLGLDNAATPLGLKAMKDLQELNPNKDTATNEQVMFLVINTSAVTLIPVSIFTYLHQLNHPNPTEVFLPILLATSFSTLTGIFVTCLFHRISLIKTGLWWMLSCIFIVLFYGVWQLSRLDPETLNQTSLIFSNFFIFGVICTFVGVAAIKKVNVYNEFITGAKDGFKTAIEIIPYLIAMLVGIGVFRASGAMSHLMHLFEMFFSGVAWVLFKMNLLDVPTMDLEFVKALPTALMKPLSGSGARGLMIETIKTYGPESMVSRIVATIQGSTETTFYVLAVYFGSVGIKNTRHAALCGLCADFAGVVSAIIICYLLF